MANPNGNPQNLKRVNKGDPSPNPAGRQADPPLMKELRKLSAIELEEMISVLIKGDVTELNAIITNKGSSVLKVMVASCCIKILKDGNTEALERILNRIIGKPKEYIHHTGDMPIAPIVNILLPSNGREAK